MNTLEAPHQNAWSLVKVTTFTVKAIGLLGLFSAILSLTIGIPSSFMAIAITIISFASLVHVRRNRMLAYVMLVLLYSNYSICFANHIYQVSSIFTSWSHTGEASQGLGILLLFASLLCLGLPNNVYRYGYEDDYLRRTETDVPLVAAICVLLSIILAYGFTRPDVVGAERGTPSQVYEYSVVFFIAGYYIAGKSRTANIVLNCLLLLYVIQNLVYGGRVTALQLLLVLFFFLLSDRVKDKVVRLILLIVFVEMTVIGSLRESWVNADFDSIVRIMSEIFKNGLTWDTAYSAWFTSLTFLAFFAGMPIERRMYYFFQWVKSVFLGGSGVVDSNLSQVTSASYTHYGGGVLPMHFGVYLGILGVIVIAAYVIFLLRWVNRLGEEKRAMSPFQRLLLVYVVVTVPRWYLYSPSQITRGVLLCCITYSIILYIDGLICKRQK